jgi:hypothetical protein
LPDATVCVTIEISLGHLKNGIARSEGQGRSAVTFAQQALTVSSRVLP